MQMGYAFYAHTILIKFDKAHDFLTRSMSERFSLINLILSNQQPEFFMKTFKCLQVFRL